MPGQGRNICRQLGAILPGKRLEGDGPPAMAQPGMACNEPSRLKAREAVCSSWQGRVGKRGGCLVEFYAGQLAA